MPKIDWIHGVSIDGSIKAVGQPIAAMADPAPREVVVHRDLKRMLDRAGIVPPPPGQLLSVADVNQKLAAANVSTNDRIAVKQQLTGLRMLSEGVGIDIFSQSR
jgi:hypothetical protein